LSILTAMTLALQTPSSKVTVTVDGSRGLLLPVSCCLQPQDPPAAEGQEPPDSRIVTPSRRSRGLLLPVNCYLQPQEPPAAGGQRGFEGGAPNAAAIFPVFFQKIKHFSSYFGLNFCLTACFQMSAKCVVDTSSRPAPRTLIQFFQNITHF